MKPNIPLVIPGASPAVQKAIQEIRAILHGGGTIADNQFAALVELPFTHGEPIQRPSPLRGGSIPKGFEVIGAWDADNVAIAFPRPKFDENFEKSGEYRLTFYADRPDAGLIGEKLESIVAAASGVPLGTTAAANVTSKSITPGTWLLSGMVVFGSALAGTPGTGSLSDAGISSSSASLGTVGDNRVQNAAGHTTTQDYACVVPPIPVTISSTTTYYLVGRSTFTNEAYAYGSLRAVRVAKYDTGVSGTVLGIMWGG